MKIKRFFSTLSIVCGFAWGITYQGFAAEPLSPKEALSLLLKKRDALMPSHSYVQIKGSFSVTRYVDGEAKEGNDAQFTTTLVLGKPYEFVFEADPYRVISNERPISEGVYEKIRVVADHEKWMTFTYAKKNGSDSEYSDQNVVRIDPFKGPGWKPMHIWRGNVYGAFAFIENLEFFFEHNIYDVLSDGKLNFADVMVQEKSEAYTLEVATRNNRSQLTLDKNTLTPVLAVWESNLRNDLGYYVNECEFSNIRPLDNIPFISIPHTFKNRYYQGREKTLREEVVTELHEVKLLSEKPVETFDQSIPVYWKVVDNRIGLTFDNLPSRGEMVRNLREIDNNSNDAQK